MWKIMLLNVFLQDEQGPSNTTYGYSRGGGRREKLGGYLLVAYNKTVNEMITLTPHKRKLNVDRETFTEDIILGL